MNISKLISLVKVIPKLGCWNVSYALWYKVSLKLGWRKKMFIPGDALAGIFFNEMSVVRKTPEVYKRVLIENADLILSGKFTYFSKHRFQGNAIPNWFNDPFLEKEGVGQNRHWSEIADFGESDIKVIWELSRFDWLTDLARAYASTLEMKYLNRINELLLDWSEHNPLNIGPNWKCGQETSIRLMKLLTTAYILEQQDRPSEVLKEMVCQHMERIYPNLNYAVAQDNNHGTSESAGLYIGAAWLIHCRYDRPKLQLWKHKGRSVLEGRLLKLIQKDGSFAQRSMTYHRVVVDTITFVLHQMDLLEEPQFSKEIQNRIKRLGEWQYKMTFGKKGDAPNYGSNDGAMFNNLHGRGYRDFRVSTQALFYASLRHVVYNNSDVSEPLFWLFGVSASDQPMYDIPRQSELLDDHVLILKKGKVDVFVKLPDSTFRPGNDPMHMDIWYDGTPAVVDLGTFSYNSGELTDQYKSIAAHNTVQFGNDEPMPRISRFLNGDWITVDSPSAISETDDNISWMGGYTDYRGNRHQRSVIVGTDEVVIEDSIRSKVNGIVRYHYDAEVAVINISENVKSIKETQSNQSLYYLSESNISAISADFDQVVSTVITFNK